MGKRSSCEYCGQAGAIGWMPATVTATAGLWTNVKKVAPMKCSHPAELMPCP